MAAHGLDTYYEIHGAGEPLLYLHGGFNPIEVTPEHAAAMVRELPEGSQLGVVPGTSHELPFEKPALVNRLVLDFLGSQQAGKLIQR